MENKKNEKKTIDKKKLFLVVGIIAFIAVLIGITAIYYHGVNADIEALESEAVDVGIIQVTDKTFNEEVLKSDKPVLLEFTSKMCLPCVSMLPTLINIAKNNEDVKVVTMDIDDSENASVVKRYGVSATPTIIIFKDEQVKKVFTGATPEEELLKELK